MRRSKNEKTRRGRGTPKTVAQAARVLKISRRTAFRRLAAGDPIISKLLGRQPVDQFAGLQKTIDEIRRTK